MKTHINLKKLLIMALLGTALLSCRKVHHAIDDEESTTAEDHSLAEHTMSDITSIGSQSSDGTSNMSSYRTVATEDVFGLSCGSVSVDSINKIVTVTFSGQACLDGHTRSGSLIFNYSASTNNAKHYRDPGFNCSVSSNNYMVDGNQINIINKTIQNTTPVGFNPATTNLTWHVSAHISIVKANNAGTVDWNATHDRTLLNTSDANVYHGSATPITWSKARVGHTGSAFGTTASNVSFNASITNMLVRDFGACNINGRHPIIQGTIGFTPGTKPTRTIDFGNGSCDLNATVSVNGKTKNITLK